MLEVSHLSKRYGTKTAVEDISFSIREREVVGFLGPNGAGKSTTMNMITGYLASSSGTAVIDGLDILQEPCKAKRKIGYLPERPPLYMDMTVEEYLTFLFRLKKVRLPKRAHLQEVCETTHIANVRDRLLKNLSKGYLQRVGLAQALLGNPKLLILDEPTVGLDPKQISEMRELIRELGRQCTIMLSSHILSEIQAVCSRVLIICDGRLAADENVDALICGTSGHSRLIVRVEGMRQQVERLLRGLPGMCAVNCLGPREELPDIYEYALEARSDLRREVSATLAQGGYPLLILRGAEQSLEERFLSIISGTAQEVSGSTNGEDASC